MKTFANIQKEIISHLKSSARSAQGVLCSLGLVVTLLLVGTGNVWGATVDKQATWTFSSSSYPSNNTNFNATGGDYKTGSYFKITNSSTGWNDSKSAFKFTCSSSAPNFFIAIKTPAAIPSGTKITLKATMWYNKSSNKPLGSAGITVSTNGGSSYSNTGLGTKTWTLGTSSAEYSTIYTTQANIAANTVIVFKLAGASRSGAGEGYCMSPSITIPVESGSTYTFHLMLPHGDGTFTQYDVTDKSLLGSSHYSDIVCKYKECYGSAAFWDGNWTNYWCPTKTNFADKTTSAGTRYNSSTSFPISSETEITLYPQFAYGSGTSYYHTDPHCPSYHVYYDGNEKTSGTVPSDATDYDGGETVTVKSATLTRTNYTFTGWNTESDGSGTHYAASGSATFTITEDVTLYAEWCRDLTTLTSSEFDLEASSITGTSARIDWLAEGATKYSVRIADNSIWASATYKYSADDVTSTDVTRTDLSPATKYWVSILAKNDCGTTTKQKTITFTTLAAYVITYYKNDGSGTSETESKTEGANYTISSNKFSRDGYTLSKWNTQSGGGGTDYAKGATYSADAALELYAVWTANNYTITLDKNGGSGGPANVSATYGSAAPSVGTLPTKADQNFAGYWTGSGGTGTMVVDASGVWVASISGYTDASKNWIGIEGKTIYAKWVDKTYTNYRTTCCDKNVTLSGGSPVNGTVVFSPAGPVATCDGAQNVTMTITPAAGYKLTVFSSSGVSASGGSPVTSGDASKSAQNIALTFAQDANGTYTASATFTAMTDHYKDQLHNTTGYTGDGKVFNATYTVPTLASTTPDSGCEGEHYKFVGWVEESYVKSDGTLNSGYTLITGGSAGTASEKTYVAIWAKEL